MATANPLFKNVHYKILAKAIGQRIESKLSSLIHSDLEDTTSLRNAMNIVNSFGVLSGLQLNKKKTKALWIGASSKNKTEPLKFQCPKEPIKRVVKG